MNVKKKLQKMNIRELKSICKDLGISCPTSKSGIIKKLLEPLPSRSKLKYKCVPFLFFFEKIFNKKNSIKFIFYHLIFQIYHLLKHSVSLLLFSY